MITALIITFISVLFLTPFVKKLAMHIGAIDRPNIRKVNTINVPRMGGLAIIISFFIGLVIAQPQSEHLIPLIIAASIIILTGILDDIYDITAKAKLAGQLSAAMIIIIFGDMQIDFVNLPFGGQVSFGYLSIPLTLLWIVGITNAINLVDGLDGLAAGISAIALITLSVMAAIMGNTFVIVFASLLAVSCLGFLFYNFYPAKIFMGDTGSLFLGFMISILALDGFKNVTMISLIIPIIILAIPIFDTIFAIVRRVRLQQSITAPDKSHLHHTLMDIGFSHLQAVLLIYAGAATLGMAAIVFSQATIWGAFLIGALLLLFIELLVELLGLAGKNYRPIISLVRGKR
ncbi:UDP-GlcNAc:undecaprenyl-phosphate GlcNAc-1-phosphate transferase [Edaphobacillus lindanitolerans]|uniref:UDP-GlcNAc:undecaprenyl-phosphate GlcNAc-1-phosphate transferase n=2 Tax=Edaphobacillus lindanitolerans TaxID=550447 RepID=A0A1U7PMB2_9BACI|nr:UDP-GlcNAc:undecaprenyl-phosphate GlcNAc-1-phosphate transferase [Edaphobacillus lindanitolerans]